MKLSLFTPTNNPIWLPDVWQSLLYQNYKDFEWVIVLNSGKKPEDVAHAIRHDTRVRVIQGPDAKNIGALKRFACDNCSGDVFIEMDHDDMLVPGALQHIADAAKRGGFIYSDCAAFRHDGTKFIPVPYSSKFGWTHYTFFVFNEPFIATRAFDPVTPRNLCEVHYAPDHVRCWTREAYYKAGGHDKNLLVADDHDLVVRTYLAGVEFAHTGYCDYLYRMHRDNSVNRYNSQIQTLQGQNRDAYSWRIVDEWCRRNSLPFLDLSGTPPEQLLARLGLGSNRWGCVKAFDVLNQVPVERLGELLNAIYDRLAPHGYLCLRCPDTDGRGAFMPSCRSYWNPEVIKCLTDRRLAPQIRSYSGRFQLVRCWQRYDSKDAESRKLLSLYADLCVLKSKEQAGVQHI